MAKIKETIREKMSQHLDVLIPEGRWVQQMDQLDRDGIPNRKQLIGMLLIMCQQQEIMENLIEDLYFRVELVEGSKTATPPTPKEFKLRTPPEIYGELDEIFTPNTKAFYVSQTDWKVLEKLMDPTLSGIKAEHGYGREVDPKDNKEKTCLYYKDIPIFKTLA